MGEPDKLEKEEKRIILYFVGISLSYIVLVGGFLVFILLLLDFSLELLLSIFSAYLTLSLATAMTFLNRPLKEAGLRKIYGLGSTLFLLTSIILFSKYFLS